ncbi:unnamed protein product [Lupinus luteus]|uniref:Uncharacterized protein n=1 Tax=Lupinus luteus TaxID=3873 RepID=A0AAV1WKX5_LUPLU
MDKVMSSPVYQIICFSLAQHLAIIGFSILRSNRPSAQARAGHAPRSDMRKLRAYTPAPGEQVPPQQLYSKSLSLTTISFVSDLSRFPSLASSKRLFPLYFVHIISHKEVTIKIHKTSRSESEELTFQLKGGGSSTKMKMERRALSSAFGS